MNVLNVNNLSKSFGKVDVVKDISFSVGDGEIVGFVGPNGAGKTTTLKLISDLIRPDKGSISVCGFDLKRNRESALKSLAGIIENPGLYPNLTGRENLSFIANLRGIDRKKFDETLEFTGLGSRIDRQVRKYSLGMKQRLALGMCLITDPKLLILDEPTNGLDPTGTMELREMIVRMSRENSVSILFSSHMLGEVEKIADRVIYIKDGVLLDKAVPSFETLYVLTVHSTKKAIELLSGLECVISAKPQDKNKMFLQLKDGGLAPVIKQLTAHEISIYDIAKQRDDLEVVYNEIFREV